MKKKLLIFTLVLLTGLVSVNIVQAAEYRYDSTIGSTGKTAGAWTYTSDDPCTITSTAYYLYEGNKIVSLEKSVSRDQESGYASVDFSLPEKGNNFTYVKSNHTVGNNIYQSEYSY